MLYRNSHYTISKAQVFGLTSWDGHPTWLVSYESNCTLCSLPRLCLTTAFSYFAGGWATCRSSGSFGRLAAGATGQTAPGMAVSGKGRVRHNQLRTGSGIQSVLVRQPGPAIRLQARQVLRGAHHSQRVRFSRHTVRATTRQRRKI